jgi:glycosidase
MARVLVLLAALCGCAPSDALPDGHCRAVVWGQPQRAGARVDVVGSWDDWSEHASMRRFDATWWVADLALPPGRYGYLVVEEGQGRLDEYNPSSTFRESDGLEVSMLEVSDCSVPHLRVEAAQPIGADAIELTLAWTPTRDDEPIDRDSIAIEGPGNASVIDVDGERVTIEVAGLPAGKHAIEIAAADAAGEAASPRRAVAWIDPRAPTLADEIVYQIVIDRFRGDTGVALAPPPQPGARAGGTLDGVLAELEAGTFDALGVSTLWLGPVYTNPVEAREGSDGHLYEGYHGYWPLDSRGVDPRIGGEAALRSLVDAAHARGMRVLLDLVPNHVYEANPRVAEHRGRGWFHEHDPQCVCGTSSCPWSEFIQTCWFTPYLPDFRFQTAGVIDLAIDDAVWWARAFDVDGFRIDAVPMMPRAVSRRIAHAVRDAAGTPGVTRHVGEVFTGPGSAGTEEIRYHLGPDGLDSAFDFPLMWALRSVVAQGASGFDEVEATLQYTAEALDGSGSPMSLIIGNHDTTRFVSVAHGDDGNDGWGDDPAVQPTRDEPYARQALALGLMLTLPGIPTIYYGDEIGLAGGRDPDSRRVLPDALTAAQVRLLDRTRRLAMLRRCLPALRRGARVPLVVADATYAFARDAGDGAPAVILVSRATNERDLIVPASSPQGAFVDALSGDAVAIGPQGASVSMPPLSLRVLVPEGHACVL